MNGTLNYGNLTDNKGIQVGSATHRRGWEAGHIDYFGRDSFSSIEQQLQRNIEHNSYQAHPRQISPEKTTIISPNVTEFPSKSSIFKSASNRIRETRKVSKSLSNRSTSITEKTTTTALVQTTFIPQQSTSTGIISQITIQLSPITTINITANVIQDRSNLSQSSNGRSINEQSHFIAQHSKLTSNPLKTSSTVFQTINNTSFSTCKIIRLFRPFFSMIISMIFFSFEKFVRHYVREKKNEVSEKMFCRGKEIVCSIDGVFVSIAIRIARS